MLCLVLSTRFSRFCSSMTAFGSGELRQASVNGALNPGAGTTTSPQPGGSQQGMQDAAKREPSPWRAPPGEHREECVVCRVSIPIM